MIGIALLALICPRPFGLGSFLPNQHMGEQAGGLVLLASMENTYFLTYRLLPASIPLNQPFSIRVAIYLDQGHTQPARNIALHVDARMPQHRHGMNRRPRITTEKPGKFLVEGMLFHMPGRWELYFDVTCDGITERAWTSFDLD